VFKNHQKKLELKNKNRNEDSRSNTRKKRNSSFVMKLRNILADEDNLGDEEISRSLDSANTNDTDENNVDTPKKKTERQKPLKLIKADINAKIKNLLPVLILDRLGLHPSLFIQNFDEANIVDQLDLYPGFTLQKKITIECDYCKKPIEFENEVISLCDSVKLHVHCLDLVK
jgi:hypothetical protein